ncbi:MAG TPA: peptidase S1 [Firmicutes bacterium]|jgi:serine protease Do|nr:peptidase S1 [Bacillota bacterium]HBS92515.1 peptidase S1 [Bacillota bacterium]HCX77800.1 peptidase S1 [Bacillota bacterium]
MEEYYIEKSPRSSRWRRFLGLVAAALLGGLIVLLCLPALLPYLLPAADISQNPNPDQVLPWNYQNQDSLQMPDLEYQQTAVVAAVSKVFPAVVGVTRISQSRDWFGRITPAAPTGYGSGVIISPGGYIVTNYHVVEDAVSVVVTLSNGQEVDAAIVGQDPGTDLAVLKIQPLADMPWAVLGDSGQLTVGEFVIAIGNPGGPELQRSVTLGIISATDRSFDVYDWVFGLLQTDAAINPGNSGGPLVNMKGEVVGINSVKITDAEGLGFSIPSNLVKSISESLIKEGRVIRPMLGVTIGEITPAIAEAYNLGSDYGLLVTETPYGGPARQAGIKPEDIIIEVNGTKTEGLRDLRRIISNKSVGDKVQVTVVRGKEKLNFEVILAELEVR